MSNQWDDLFGHDVLDVEVKAVGRRARGAARSGLGKLGRLGGAAGDFDESLHPRDSRGRFIEKGSTVRLRGGGTGEVIGRGTGDMITVRRTDNGKTYNYDKGSLTVTARPGGGAPTAKEDDRPSDLAEDPTNDLIGDTQERLDQAQGSRTASARPVQPVQAVTLPPGTRAAPDADPDGADTVLQSRDGRQQAWLRTDEGASPVGYLRLDTGDPRSTVRFDSAEQWAKDVDRRGMAEIPTTSPDQRQLPESDEARAAGIRDRMTQEETDLAQSQVADLNAQRAAEREASGGAAPTDEERAAEIRERMSPEETGRAQQQVADQRAAEQAAARARGEGPQTDEERAAEIRERMSPEETERAQQQIAEERTRRSDLPQAEEQVVARIDEAGGIPVANEGRVDTPAGPDTPDAPDTPAGARRSDGGADEPDNWNEALQDATDTPNTSTGPDAPAGAEQATRPLRETARGLTKSMSAAARDHGASVRMKGVDPANNRIGYKLKVKRGQTRQAAGAMIDGLKARGFTELADDGGGGVLMQDADGTVYRFRFSTPAGKPIRPGRARRAPANGGRGRATGGSGRRGGSASNSDLADDEEEMDVDVDVVQPSVVVESERRNPRTGEVTTSREERVIRPDGTTETVAERDERDRRRRETAASGVFTGGMKPLGREERTPSPAPDARERAEARTTPATEMELIQAADRAQPYKRDRRTGRITVVHEDGTELGEVVFRRQGRGGFFARRIDGTWGSRIYRTEGEGVGQLVLDHERTRPTPSPDAPEAPSTVDAPNTPDAPAAPEAPRTPDRPPVDPERKRAAEARVEELFGQAGRYGVTPEQAIELRRELDDVDQELRDVGSPDGERPRRRVAQIRELLDGHDRRHRRDAERASASASDQQDTGPDTPDSPDVPETDDAPDVDVPEDDDEEDDGPPAPLIVDYQALSDDELAEAIGNAQDEAEIEAIEAELDRRDAADTPDTPDTPDAPEGVDQSTGELVDEPTTAQVDEPTAAPARRDYTAMTDDELSDAFGQTQDDSELDAIAAEMDRRDAAETPDTTDAPNTPDGPQAEEEQVLLPADEVSRTLQELSARSDSADEAALAEHERDGAEQPNPEAELDIAQAEQQATRLAEFAAAAPTYRQYGDRRYVTQDESGEVTFAPLDLDQVDPSTPGSIGDSIALAVRAKQKLDIPGPDEIAVRNRLRALANPEPEFGGGPLSSRKHVGVNQLLDDLKRAGIGENDPAMVAARSFHAGLDPDGFEDQQERGNALLPDDAWAQKRVGELIEAGKLRGIEATEEFPEAWQEAVRKYRAQNGDPDVPNTPDTAEAPDAPDVPDVPESPQAPATARTRRPSTSRRRTNDAAKLAEDAQKLFEDADRGQISDDELRARLDAADARRSELGLAEGSRAGRWLTVARDIVNRRGPAPTSDAPSAPNTPDAPDVPDNRSVVDVVRTGRMTDAQREQTVLDAISDMPTSPGEMARMTGLSRQDSADILARLASEGLIADNGGEYNALPGAPDTPSTPDAPEGTDGGLFGAAPQPRPRPATPTPAPQRAPRRQRNAGLNRQTAIQGGDLPFSPDEDANQDDLFDAVRDAEANTPDAPSTPDVRDTPSSDVAPAGPTPQQVGERQAQQSAEIAEYRARQLVRDRNRFQRDRSGGSSLTADQLDSLLVDPDATDEDRARARADLVQMTRSRIDRVADADLPEALNRIEASSMSAGEKEAARTLIAERMAAAPDPADGPGAVGTPDTSDNPDTPNTPRAPEPRRQEGADSTHVLTDQQRSEVADVVTDIPTSPGEVSIRTGVTQEQAREILDEFSNAGFTVRTADGRYVTPNEAMAEAEDVPVPDVTVDDAAAEAIPRNAPEQLPGESYPPTPQQQDVIDAVLAGKNTKVQAKAGAGKTSTLEALARRLQVREPDVQVAYIAFNKSVQVEADKRMPGNVEPRTGHSIAYQWASRDVQSRTRDKAPLRRPDDVAAHLGIRKTLKMNNGPDVDPTEQAMAAMRTVDTWSNSDADEITKDHLPESIKHLPAFAQDAVLDQARAAWADLQAKDGKLRLSLDHVRKMWALSRPDLTRDGSGLKKKATVLFLDEAQDTPPVLAKVVADQKMRKVIVGDGDQAIYGFTGATDYLSDAEGDVELPLNKSWRFGPEVADVGNRFLQMLGSKGRVEGAGGPSKVTNDMAEPDAILVRSNGGMIGEIQREQDAGRLVGVPKGTKQDLQSLVESSRYLMGFGRAPSRMHDDLAPFRDWDELRREAERGDDPKLAMLVRIVDNNGLESLDNMVREVIEVGGDDGLPGVTFTDMPHGRVAGGNTFAAKDSLRAAGFRWMEVPGAAAGRNGPKKAWTAVGTPEERDARVEAARGKASQKPDVMVSTAHKAKGLEWDKVRIGEDFRGPKVDEAGNVEMPDDEEFRLAYVAVTRAQKEIDPGSLSYVYDYTDYNGGQPGDAPRTPGTLDGTDAPNTPEVPSAPEVPDTRELTDDDITTVADIRRRGGTFDDMRAATGLRQEQVIAALGESDARGRRDREAAEAAEAERLAGATVTPIRDLRPGDVIADGFGKERVVDEAVTGERFTSLRLRNEDGSVERYDSLSPTQTRQVLRRAPEATPAETEAPASQAQVQVDPNAPLAQRVAGYRARVAADPDRFDGDLDVATWLLNDSDRTYSPSELGRALGIGTTDAQAMLQQLAGDNDVSVTGNGARARYGRRGGAQVAAGIERLGERGVEDDAMDWAREVAAGAPVDRNQPARSVLNRLQAQGRIRLDVGPVQIDSVSGRQRTVQGIRGVTVVDTPNTPDTPAAPDAPDAATRARRALAQVPAEELQVGDVVLRGSRERAITSIEDRDGERAVSFDGEDGASLLTTGPNGNRLPVIRRDGDQVGATEQAEAAASRRADELAAGDTILVADVGGQFRATVVKPYGAGNGSMRRQQGMTYRFEEGPSAGREGTYDRGPAALFQRVSPAPEIAGQLDAVEEAGTERVGPSTIRNASPDERIGTPRDVTGKPSSRPEGVTEGADAGIIPAGEELPEDVRVRTNPDNVRPGDLVRTYRNTDRHELMGSHGVSSDFADRAGDSSDSEWLRVVSVDKSTRQTRVLGANPAGAQEELTVWRFEFEGGRYGFDTTQPSGAWVPPEMVVIRPSEAVSARVPTPPDLPPQVTRLKPNRMEVGQTVQFPDDEGRHVITAVVKDRTGGRYTVTTRDEDGEVQTRQMGVNDKATLIEDEQAAADYEAAERPIGKPISMTAVLGDEVRYASEVMESDGFDPGFTIDPNGRMQVTDVGRALYTLNGPREIQEDNADPDSGNTAAERRKARAMEARLQKLMDSVQALDPEARQKAPTVEEEQENLAQRRAAVAGSTPAAPSAPDTPSTPDGADVTAEPDPEEVPEPPSRDDVRAAAAEAQRLTEAWRKAVDDHGYDSPEVEEIGAQMNTAAAELDRVTSNGVPPTPAKVQATLDALTANGWRVAPDSRYRSDGEEFHVIEAMSPDGERLRVSYMGPNGRLKSTIFGNREIRGVARLNKLIVDNGRPGGPDGRSAPDRTPSEATTAVLDENYQAWTTSAVRAVGLARADGSAGMLQALDDFQRGADALDTDRPEAKRLLAAARGVDAGSIGDDDPDLPEVQQMLVDERARAVGYLRGSLQNLTVLDGETDQTAALRVWRQWNDKPPGRLHEDAAGIGDGLAETMAPEFDQDADIRDREARIADARTRATAGQGAADEQNVPWELTYDYLTEVNGNPEVADQFDEYLRAGAESGDPREEARLQQWEQFRAARGFEDEQYSSAYDDESGEQARVEINRWMRDNGVPGLTHPDVRGDFLPPEKRSTATRAEVTAAYDLFVEEQYLRAEADTRGVMVNRAGEAKGISPRQLMSGPVDDVYRYASPELLEWFETNRRMQLSEFGFEMTGQAGFEKAARRQREANSRINRDRTNRRGR